MSFLDTLRKNLTPEQYTTITDALGDDFDFDLVPRARLNKVIKQRNELREQLAGAAKSQNTDPDSDEDKDDVDTGSGKKKDVDIEALKKQWKADQDKAVQEVKLQYAALEKLRAANAIDAELIWSGNVIDKTKISFDANGAITGLDEAIADLQKNRAHLFNKKADDDVKPGTGKKGGEDFKGVTTKEEFLKLDADKQIAFKQANPTLFKQFLQS